MSRQAMAIVTAIIWCAQALAAAPREVIETRWDVFQREVASRRLLKRPARVTLANGETVGTRVLRTTETALVVAETRSTRQWKTRENEAEIPNEQVARVRFGGRVGGHGLAGGLVGLGAGAGIAAATVTRTDVSEGPFIIILPIAGVAMAGIGALSGYFIGRRTGRPAPEFVLVH